MNRLLPLAASFALAVAGVAASQNAPTPTTPPAPTPAAPASPERPPTETAPSKPDAAKEHTPVAPKAPDSTAPDAKSTLPAKQRAKDIKEVRGTIETAGGKLTFKLEPNKCPLLCANFCNLVRKGFFDGRTWCDFSRVIRQAGTQGVSYTLPREFDPSLFFDRGGRIAMSKDRDESAGARSNGTRFFITVKNQERWNLDYPIFGNVTSGLDLMFAIKEGDSITKITVEGDVDNLLKTFAPEVAEWDKALDDARTRGLLR